MGQLVIKVELRMKDTASNIEMTTHLNRNQNEAYLPECNESEIHYESKWPNFVRQTDNSGIAYTLQFLW